MNGQLSLTMIALSCGCGVRRWAREFGAEVGRS